MDRNPAKGIDRIVKSKIEKLETLIREDFCPFRHCPGGLRANPRRKLPDALSDC